MDWLNNLKLKSKDAAVRRSMIEKLGATRNPKALGWICESLGDDMSEVRASAAAALVNFPEEKSLELLVGALQDPAAEVREAAATSLGRMEDPRACEHLVAVLRDTAPNVRGSVAAALRNLGWVADNAESQALFEVAIGNVKAAAFRGVAAVNPLV